MPRLQRKAIAEPDQVRTFPFGRADIVNLDETAIVRFVCEPGWRWSAHVAPTVRTSTCQNRHVGYAIAGRLHAVMDDGTQLDIVAGDAYEIPAGHDAWVVGDEIWDTVEFTSGRVFGIAPDADDERMLATILFTDIVDSTRTQERLGDREWRRILLDHNDRSRAELDQYRGREVVTTGDGFLAIFDSPGRAVRGAAAIIEATRPLGLEVRAGLHTGEVVIVGSNARGAAVHTAARIAALAGPGEVWVSGTTHDLLDGSNLRFRDGGRHALKGIEGDKQAYILERD